MFVISKMVSYGDFSMWIEIWRFFCNKHCGLWILGKIFRSSRSEVFCEKSVVKSFAKFKRKHLFSVSFARFLATPVLQNTPQRLLCKHLQKKLKIVWQFSVLLSCILFLLCFRKKANIKQKGCFDLIKKQFGHG